MNIGIIILCRYESTRLPGKILREIRGRTVLGHILDRLRLGVPGYPVVVATSLEASDDPIARYCRREGVPCFRGSLDDVASRFLSCAECYGWDFAVRINGDNIFTDPCVLQSMLAIAGTDIYDFITNVPGRTFPYGMSVEILRVTFYREAVSRFGNTDDHEHVTQWLYQHPELGCRYVYVNNQCPEAKGLKLALDTEEDLLRTERIFTQLSGMPASAGLAEIAYRAGHTATPSPWRGRHGPLLIAEIGGNHEGNFDKAMTLVDLAAETKVDCIKFQLYRGDTLVNPIESPDRNTHFKKFELTREQHIALVDRCREKGVEYMASVWDLDMLDWIDPYLKRYKIGSGDLTAWPIIREFARRGKPMILATGLATLDEVRQSVACVQAVDVRYRQPEWLCLLQCTSMYPIPDEEANLCAIDTLRSATGLAVGYSDHTVGGLALRMAAAMGAEVLEFHFTDSRDGKTFRDHKVSLTPLEVINLQRDLDQITALRGNGVKIPQPSEVEQGHLVSFRRAVYPNRDLAAKSLLRSNDLILLRPNCGLDARDSDVLTGKTISQNISAMSRLNETMI